MILSWTIIAASSALSQNQINRLQIADSSSLLIYLNESSQNYETKLSEDKKTIFITVPNSTVADSAKKAYSEGEIREVYAFVENDSAKLKIYSSERTGYAAPPLPYSQAIMLETFKWKKLNKPEDLYRSGSLALEDSLYKTAEDYFRKAAELGEPNAAARLGFIQLRKGELKNALKNLLYARKVGTNIPDAYAALSQIYGSEGLNKRANEFEKKFQELTGLKDYPELLFGEPEESQKLDKETILLLEKINKPKEDEIAKKTKDSLNAKFDKALGDDKDKESESLTGKLLESFFPENFFDYIILIGAIIVAAGLILYFAYLRWKKNEMEKKKKVIKLNRKEFNEDLDSAKKKMGGKKMAAEAYKKAEAASDNQDNKKKEAQTSTKPAKEKKSEPLPKSESESKNREIDFKKDFENKVDRIARQLIAAQKQKTLEEYEQELKKEKEGQFDAQAKLASQMQAKKKQIKLDNLKNIEKELPNDEKKLEQIAKELGLEKESLKTKKRIENLLNDEKSIEELKRKFSGD